jgi:hypothetical protein
LLNRLNDYTQPAYLTNKKHLLIIRALIKYGLLNFSIVILEYVNSESITLREDLNKAETK